MYYNIHLFTFNGLLLYLLKVQVLVFSLNVCHQMCVSRFLWQSDSFCPHNSSKRVWRAVGIKSYASTLVYYSCCFIIARSWCNYLDYADQRWYALESSIFLSAFNDLHIRNLICKEMPNRGIFPLLIYSASYWPWMPWKQWQNP